MRLGLGYLGMLALSLNACLCYASADVFNYPVADNAARVASLEQLAGKLAAQTEVNGEFVQEKFLSVLTKPLHSRGFFSASAQGTFDWRITHPFSISYHFTDGKLYKQTEESRDLVRPSDDPMLYGFFTFFSSVFDMSHADLEKMFELYFTKQDGSWVLGLLPKNDLLKGSVQSIVVEGRVVEGKVVEGEIVDNEIAGIGAMSVIIKKVTIHEPSGDYSHLLFSY